MQVAEAGRTREGDPNTSCTPLDSKHLVYYEQLVSSVSLFTSFKPEGEQRAVQLLFRTYVVSCKKVPGSRWKFVIPCSS